MGRARGIQIYLKEGIAEDEVLLNLWEICKTQSRPQEVFRRLLQRGLKELIKEEELSSEIIEQLSYRIPVTTPPKEKSFQPKVTSVSETNNKIELDDLDNALNDISPPRASQTAEQVEYTPTKKELPKKRTTSNEINFISKDLM